MEAKNGEYTEFYPLTTRIRSNLRKKNRWKHIQNKPIKKSRSNYKDGKLHGKYIEWYKGGQKSYECDYVNGKKNGKLLKYHENGAIWEETSYVDGKLNGDFKSWFYDGAKQREASYKDGELHGNSVEWHWNKEMSIRCNYKEGNWDGKWEQWFEDGTKKSECNYINGKYDGKSSVWLQLPYHLYYEIDYKDGKRHGVHTIWYANGNKAGEHNLKNDIPEGKLTNWNYNGELYSIVELRNGSRTETKEYENGKINKWCWQIYIRDESLRTINILPIQREWTKLNKLIKLKKIRHRKKSIKLLNTYINEHWPPVLFIEIMAYLTIDEVSEIIVERNKKKELQLRQK